MQAELKLSDLTIRVDTSNGYDRIVITTTEQLKESESSRPIVSVILDGVQIHNLFSDDKPDYRWMLTDRQRDAVTKANLQPLPDEAILASVRACPGALHLLKEEYDRKSQELRMAQGAGYIRELTERLRHLAIAIAVRTFEVET